jgi:hypothetical protein
MVRHDEFIQIPCTQDMIQAGTAYVTRRMVQQAGPAPDTRYDYLRQGVADKIVDLAFRRLLSEQKIPHQFAEPASYAHPDEYEIAFGGRRSVVFGQLVCQREEIKKVHRDPNLFSNSQVFLPDSTRPTAYRDVDLYIFGFITGLVTRNVDDLQRALNSGHPIHLVYPMPQQWAVPEVWGDLGQLVLKGDIFSPITVTLYGLDGHRGVLHRSVSLPSQERIEAGEGFYTLGAVSLSALPDGPVGVYSPRLDEINLIAPHQWGNLWVYGIKIYLVGYLSQGDFYRKAEKLPAGNRPLGNPHLRETGLAVRMSELRPLGDLFVRAENWVRGRGK